VTEEPRELRDHAKAVATAVSQPAEAVSSFKLSRKRLEDQRDTVVSTLR
jgi:hypothetical protein